MGFLYRTCHRRQSLEQRLVKRARVLHLWRVSEPPELDERRMRNRLRGRPPVMAELGAHLGRRGILADRGDVLLSDGHAGEILLDDGEASNCDSCGGPHARKGWR